MNPIVFDTDIHQAAARNGWDNCDPDEDGFGRWLSSTAHEGLLHVFPEGDFFCIVPTEQPVQKVTRDELPQALRTLVETDTAPKGSQPLRTEREATVKARTAQHRYRAGLEALWGGKCSCTGVGMAELLRASHAKPWKDCTDAERVDPYNGFLLEARYDALFDQGFISFADDGALLLSPCLSESEIRRLGLPRGLRVQGIAPQHHRYLQWHREHVFQAAALACPEEQPQGDVTPAAGGRG